MSERCFTLWGNLFLNLSGGQNVVLMFCRMYSNVCLNLQQSVTQNFQSYRLYINISLCVSALSCSRQKHLVPVKTIYFPGNFSRNEWKLGRPRTPSCSSAVRTVEESEAQRAAWAHTSFKAILLINTVNLICFSSHVFLMCCSFYNVMRLH